MATLAERLDRRLDKSGDCWLWTGCMTSHGYGKIRPCAGEQISTHRAAWQLANGPIPKDMCVLHECDTPLCCNPAHLHLGTQQDNLQEMRERGRWRAGRALGESNAHAKLTESQVRAIRGRWGTGDVSQSELAREHDVSRQAICYIVHRDTWRHI